jgi:hypothetical protein
LSPACNIDEQPVNDTAKTAKTNKETTNNILPQLFITLIPF